MCGSSVRERSLANKDASPFLRCFVVVNVVVVAVIVITVVVVQSEAGPWKTLPSPEFLGFSL